MPRNIKLTSTAKSPKAKAAVKAKPGKPTATVKPDAPVPDNKPREKRTHEIALTYSGPSPTVRGHERKLSAIRTDLGAGRITPRDETFIADIVSQYRERAFTRFDTDAGCVRRAIAHGFLEHVSGDLKLQSATFKATKRGLDFAGNRNAKAKS